MRFKRQKRDKVYIDVTNLVDVVFLLLIFFILSATLTKKTQLNVDLPQARAGQAQVERTDAVEVVITPDGEYTVNGQRLINHDFDTLKNAISQIVNNDNQRPFLITADAKTTHESVVKVMDVAGQLGLTNLSITTVHPDE